MEKTDVTVQSPAGGGGVRTETRPGSPLNLAQATLIRTLAAVAWLVGSAWAFGRAIEVWAWLAFTLSAIPALTLMVSPTVVKMYRARSSQ